MRFVTIFFFLVVLISSSARGAETGWPFAGVGRHIVFSQDFSAISFSKNWATLFPSEGRHHDKELEIYVDPGFLATKNISKLYNPFQIDKGRLVLVSRRLDPKSAYVLGSKYTSGMLTTAGRRLFQYGYFEMRARLPRGAGLWPAFWLMRPGVEPYAEIDIMEALGDRSGKIYSTLHHGPTWKTRKIDGASIDLGKGGEAAFHVYAVDWNEKTITFLVDGCSVATYPTAPELRAPMYIIIDVAIGGPFEKYVEPASFPARMYVDYVRVWQ